ncbi:hypothetical protein [Phormidium tenue]|uniref:Uncharacterized protein n=1 Tax=Phormidium tenue NIES-30 TaxID=549789 RepID=A0A1U7JB40_9CYAN|nr:hypothetical protein [Phormidium tenue]MBD2230235.1 hypothetical protein [Phormidium tenue FACHB-1052]OKH50946.1 hypothetical protein NIES30_02385 [Phormidium tenue NIES-30]
MTHPVQDRVKTEWEKAQKEGGQRASRIREIVKAAAAEALAELREGSGEIETQGRKTLAEMIAQLRANEAADAAAAEAVADAVAEAVQAESLGAEAAVDTDAPAPTWSQIFADLRYLANDRKVDWAQQILSGLQTQVDRFDADMAKEYGDRYDVVRPLVRGFRSLVALAYSKLGQPAEPPAPTPVHIVVLDDVETSADDATNV